jgi:hypothetical protein
VIDQFCEPPENCYRHAPSRVPANFMDEATYVNIGKVVRSRRSEVLVNLKNGEVGGKFEAEKFRRRQSLNS